MAHYIAQQTDESIRCLFLDFVGWNAEAPCSFVFFFKVKPAAHFSQNQITSDQPAVGGHLDKERKIFGVLFIFIFILTMAMISKPFISR